MSAPVNAATANKMHNPNFILRMPAEHGKTGVVSYEERPIPEIGPMDVLVEVSLPI